MKIKRIVALLLTLVMLFSFTACKKKITGNVNDIPIVPGTLYAGFEWAVEDVSEKENYLGEGKESDKNRFIDIATNYIGLTEEKAKALFAEPNTWSIYRIDVQISNNTDTTKTFVGFTATGLTEGIWLNTAGSFEFTVPSKVTDEVYPAYILVDTATLSKVDMYNALSKMKLELVYFETPADGSDEVSESEYKKFLVTNNLVAPTPDAQSETLISAKRVSVTANPSWLEDYKNNHAAFNSESKHFGFDSATASAMLAEGSPWQSYVLDIEVENKTSGNLNIYRIIAENNGKNGIWVCGVSNYGEEYGMPANFKQTLSVNVLVNTSAIGDKSAEEAIKAVKIQLEYFAGDYEDLGDEDAVVKSFITVK